MRKETNSFHILNTCSLEIELGRNVDLLADVFAVLFPLAHALGQKILDLAVDGAEIVLCPGGDGGVELGGQAQGHLLFGVVVHGSLPKSSAAQLIQAAGVDDGLGIVVAAQHHEQVRDHGRLALLVELDRALFRQTLKRHFDHADRAVDDHLARVDDGAGLLALEHDGRNLGRIGEVGDARFDDLKARVGDLGLNFIADACGHDLARAAKAALVGLTVARGVDVRGDIVGIDAHDIAQCCVALEGQVFLIVVHVKHGLGCVGHAPHHGDSDFHGVTETVVDLLAGVVERHDLERDLLAGAGLDRGGRALHGSEKVRALVAAVHVAGLVELRLGGGVERRAEGIDPVEALALERADVLAEQRQHQRLLRLQNAQAAQWDPAEQQQDDAKDDKGQKARIDADDQKNDRGDVENKLEQQHEHAVFVTGDDLFFHKKHLQT